MLIEEIGNNKPLKNEIHSALVFLFKCYFAARDAAEKIGRKELKSWNEQMKIHWGEIVEFLNFPKPKDIQYAFASFILEQRDMPGSAKYALAKLALEQTLESLNERNLSKEAGNNLLREVDRLKAQYPRDTAIFAEVLWKTKCITAEPDNKQYENDYTALAQKVAKRRWGKIIIGAMLGVAFAAAFTLACISTCGVSLGLGLVALSLNYLIPTAAASAMTSIVGFSLFVKGLEKNKKLQHLSQTMAETMKMKGKKDGEEKIPHHHKR